MMIPLSFDHLDDQADHLQSVLSVEAAELRDTPRMSDSVFMQLQEDYGRISETLSIMAARKGVCKEDVTSLESLRDRYPVLDKFLNDNPIQMYTTESSIAMYDVSMENFLVNAGKALWNLLVGLAKWIWNHLKNFWDWITGKTINSRKVDAKLRAFNDIGSYLVQVPDFTSDVSVIRAGITKVRDERIQDMNKVLKGYHDAFLKNPKEYNQLIEKMTTGLAEGMAIINTEIDQLISDMTKATTEADVTALSGKYDQLLKTDLAYSAVIKMIDPVVNQLPTIKSTYAQPDSLTDKGRELHKKLNSLAISKENNTSIAMHPKVYQKMLVEGDKSLNYIAPATMAKLDGDIKKMVAEARRFHEKLLGGKPANAVVEKAFLTSGVGKLVAHYQARVNGFQRMHKVLSDILDVRNEVIDLIVKTALMEFNKVREVMEKNKDKLSIQSKARHDSLVDRVRTSVNHSRL